MYLIREVFDWVAAATLLEKGVEWHCGYMPVEQKGPHSVILERPGDPMQPYLRHNVGVYGFQILTIGPLGSNYWQGRDQAELIYQAVGDVNGAILGDGTYANEWYADVIAARSQPYYLGGDLRYQFEISFDIDVSARTPATLMVL